MPSNHMILSLLATGTGSHGASWLAPETDPAAAVSIKHFRHLAQVAEKGMFDLFFVADTPAARTEKLEQFARFPTFMNQLEPITLLAAVAEATSHIGLGGTVTTSFNEPYNVARQIASLDHICGGRAAWNVVTSSNDFAARNFGHSAMPPHAERYARAREFVKVVQELWETWEDGAFIRDRRQGLFFDPSKQHAVCHRGEHFVVEGALNIERTPQGRPIIIQAGASEDGKQLAAETADVVFASNSTIEKAAAFYADLKDRLPGFGRARDSLKVLAGFPVVVGLTDEAARRKFAALQDLIHPEAARIRLEMDFGADLSGLELDKPIPEDRIPATSNLNKGYFDYIVEMIRVERLTLREIAMRYQRGHTTLCGSPNTIADTMEAWLGSHACDGFMMIFPTLPDELEMFVSHVVPELQRRRLLRTRYEGSTLRHHLCLDRPPHPAQS